LRHRKANGRLNKVIGKVKSSAPEKSIGQNWNYNKKGPIFIFLNNRVNQENRDTHQARTSKTTYELKVYKSISVAVGMVQSILFFICLLISFGINLIIQ
jgi:hypothetical protein